LRLNQPGLLFLFLVGVGIEVGKEIADLAHGPADDLTRRQGRMSGLHVTGSTAVAQNGERIEACRFSIRHHLPVVDAVFGLFLAAEQAGNPAHGGEQTGPREGHLAALRLSVAVHCRNQQINPNEHGRDNRIEQLCDHVRIKPARNQERGEHGAKPLNQRLDEIPKQNASHGRPFVFLHTKANESDPNSNDELVA